jgi:acyl dehydratase
MVRQFAEMSGDFNPIHLDDEYAKNTRFGRRIAHGMICGALISRALAMELGPGGIYLSQSMKFQQPVFIDDTLSIELTVLAERKEKGIATIETLVKKTTGETCVKGEAIIMRGEFL